MSARPRPETLPPGELDLLLSRRIDGDLSQGEAAELDASLAGSPEARARLSALSRVVADLREAPAPAASFALATRVFSHVLENSGAVSGLFHRFGVAPRTGYLFALIGGVCLVAVGLLSKNRPAETVASVASGTPSRDVVSVFIQPSRAPAEAKRGEAPASAPRSPAPAKAAPAPAAPVAVLADASASRESREGREGPEGREGSEARAGRVAKAQERGEPTEPLAPRELQVNAAAPTGFAPEQSAARRADAPSPVPAGAGGAAVAAAAAPARASAAREKAEASDLETLSAAPGPAPAPPSISLVAPGGGPASWKLAAIPGLASLRGPLSARYRLTVSAQGRVTAIRKISATPDPLPAAVETLFQELRLERVQDGLDASEVEVKLTVP